jgi:hypothetical protein
VPRAVARAVCRHEYNDELRVVVRSVLAYRAESRDGWKGPWRGSMGEAKIDARERNHETAKA